MGAGSDVDALEATALACADTVTRGSVEVASGPLDVVLTLVGAS